MRASRYAAKAFILQSRGARYDQPCKEQVLAAYQDRMSSRGIWRTFGVCCKTGRRWLGKKAEQLPAFVDTLLPSQRGDGLELDELWSFVGSKAQTLWRWVALCRRTRQVVAWTLGDRSLQSACDLRASLPEDHRRCATRNNFLGSVPGGFPCQNSPLLRQRGRRDQPRGALVWHLAGARVSRLVRKAYSFSKCAENHLDAVHFFITTYNLAIPQQATKR